MAIPYLQINSMTYSSSVLTINTSYGYLRGGGSVSIAGLSATLYYSITESYGTNITKTFSIAVETGTTNNLTFSFYKGPYYNYPIGTPNRIGITQASTSSSCGPFVSYSGGVPYNLGIATFSSVGVSYEVTRTYNYTFRN